MKALVLKPSDKTLVVKDIPTPVPGPGEVLVQVHAIALNPVDALYSFEPIAKQPERVVGTDFSGIVVETGPGLEDSAHEQARRGIRVSGFLQGASSVNDRPGAFAEFVVIPCDLLWVVPKDISLASASAVSMCGLTAAQSLFTRLDLPNPFGALTPISSRDTFSPEHVVIYGASTSLGLYAAQLIRASAKASGRAFKLIGVASTSKHPFLRQAPYLYDTLVDYRDPSWPDQVKSATVEGKGVQYALDCISEGETPAKVHSTFAADIEGDGHFAVFRSPGGGGYTADLRVRPMYGAVWEGLGVEVEYNSATLPANPAARAFAVDFFASLSSRNGVRLEPNPVRLMPGGLARVPLDGFQLLGNDRVSARAKPAATQATDEWMRPVSGEKLVYVIKAT